mmetsp:Transcript_8870/g.14402  ORF Transcript_8870/g.14402 Transcript_8870/m.14402 type:complete len:460 (+) Transcript_8870:944-2323(+)|eukprot:CAMPEP_0203792862 /NCGR_PEP_ID=MMETSP0100_2-20121128/5512_1 /ASSEMBLY_ACC=CAM_ASM_000210 /TAXON_ID=96639 /ORGANISM=" , Strain NY0313808BC1" /LENGTH=459 /DNA_ID=CAMNT_0050696511 /DNA_START=813 /DNA_END=2188 /DNA_ORIENTATION=-
MDKLEQGVHPEQTDSDHYESHVNLSSAVLYADQGVSPGDGGVALKQGITWKTVGLLQVCDVLGVGMLTIGSAYAQLGWLISILAFAIGFVMCVYLGVLQWKCQRIYPKGTSQRNLAYEVYGSKIFANFIGFMLYGLLFFVCGAYLMGMASSLANLFVGVADLCDWEWRLIACAVISPLICFIRNLTGLKHLVKLSTTLIIGLVAVVSIYVFVQLGQGKHEEGFGTDEFVKTGLTVKEFITGLSSIFLSIGGLIIFLEMSAEMSNREEFPKSFFVSVPIEVLLMMLVGCSSYVFQGGNASDLMSVIPADSGIGRFANFLSFTYMTVVFLIKGIIIVRGLHEEIFPSSFDAIGFKGKIHHFGIAATTMVLMFLCVNVIPSIGSFVSLIAAVFVPFLTYMLPVVYAFKTRRNIGQSTPFWEWLVWAFVIVVFSIITVSGTYFWFESMYTYFANNPPPFTCHA